MFIELMAAKRIKNDLLSTKKKGKTPESHRKSVSIHMKCMKWLAKMNDDRIVKMNEIEKDRLN